MPRREATPEQAVAAVAPELDIDLSQVQSLVEEIDPHGNLMLRFPKDADPRKMHKDLARLLRASRIG